MLVLHFLYVCRVFLNFAIGSWLQTWPVVKEARSADAPDEDT